MSKRGKSSASGAMLDLWRPPKGAGDPVGCLATTYTFSPGLFDEQCLARFLEIESEPDREDLAFLLERESRLGSVYAGILVDYTQAGVEHSLRWDVLPVRIRAGKQHAKLSLLVWSRSIRIIVASANLSEPGYRTNYEVALPVDLSPDTADTELLAQAIAFLKDLVRLVPAAQSAPPEVQRATTFLDHAERLTHGWTSGPKRGSVRQHLVCTLPAVAAGNPARSSLEEAVEVCRRRGGSPDDARVASPFFDSDAETNVVAASLCKSMARGGRRRLAFCVPAVRDIHASTRPRLAAPVALINTPARYQGDVTVLILPDADEARNRRPWHAKLLALSADRYSALMIGSSNFTKAGMGVDRCHNAEANLLTIVDRVSYAREVGLLEAVWPAMESVLDPSGAEWLGAQADADEEEQASAAPLPQGFLSATYRAGDHRRILLRLDPSHLPQDWSVHACGRTDLELLSAAGWREGGGVPVVEFAWADVQPPDKLLVRWAEKEAFLPLNVEDSRALPPPPQLHEMSADDMLSILAAADPSAAFRAWARSRQPAGDFDHDLDSATPVDLEPLRRYDLQATFLHRVRRRARVLAHLRANLQRPVYGRQALEWRLRGLVGIDALADRLLHEFVSADGAADEALLTLADFLIVLAEVDYQDSDGALPKGQFQGVFRPFLRELAARLHGFVEPRRACLPPDLMRFWEQVVSRCHE